jgi:hypothetical protein
MEIRLSSTGDDESCLSVREFTYTKAKNGSAS